MTKVTSILAPNYDPTIKRLMCGNKTMQQMFADTQAQAVLPESEKE